jgi:hypothetical protein
MAKHLFYDHFLDGIPSTVLPLPCQFFNADRFFLLPILQLSRRCMLLAAWKLLLCEKPERSCDMVLPNKIERLIHSLQKNASDT